jgi:transcriptional regulator with XRE-family HTH domain
MSMEVVATWTGERADALRQALRMTIESYAAHLGVAVRTVAYWRERPQVIPRPSMQEILDTALTRAPAAARMQFTLILAEREQNQDPSTSGIVPAPRSADLASWVTASNVSDEAIEQIDRAVAGLTGRHTQEPARQLLAGVLQAQGQAQLILASGRQRLGQARELIRIEGQALAHASVLLGDLGQDHEATRYGKGAEVYLREAAASPRTRSIRPGQDRPLAARLRQCRRPGRAGLRGRPHQPDGSPARLLRGELRCAARGPGPRSAGLAQG